MSVFHVGSTLSRQKQAKSAGKGEAKAEPAKATSYPHSFSSIPVHTAFRDVRPVRPATSQSQRTTPKRSRQPAQITRSQKSCNNSRASTFVLRLQNCRESNQIKSNSHQRRHPSQYCAQSGLCMGFAAWRQMLTNHDHHRRFSSLFVVPRMGCTYTNRNRLRLTLCLNQFSHVRRLNLQLQQQMGRRSLLRIQSSLIVWLSKFLSGSPYED